MEESEKPRISWGVDGQGNKHYDCNYCGLYFGNVDKQSIFHSCDTSKPKDHNRGKIQEFTHDG